MGFLERRAGQFRPPADGAARRQDRYSPQAGSRNGGSGDPLYDPTAPRRANADPVARPAAPAGRPDLSGILGRTVLEARTQQICRAYGLIPRSGPATGSGLSRSYLARDAGVEIAADSHGVVTTVFLHFHGDDGFASFHGEIPGGAGTVPRRAALWASLGRPGVSGDPYREKFLGDFGPWDRWLLPGFVLHAQYALDGENLHRITLTLPDRSSTRAA
jgi:hypothetical protein